MILMKFQKNVSFDAELMADISKEKNLSKLINSLLREHYKEGDQE